MREQFTKSLLAKFSLLLVMAALFFSCQKDVDNSGTINPPVDPNTNLDLTTKVNATSISGFVTDEADAVVAGATVSIGGTTITTDRYGYFIARNVSVVKNAAVIAVSKTGYFKGIKTYIASEGKSAFFRIKLLTKNLTPVGFAATTGGTVTSADGISIIFPANAIVTSAGAPYSGSVKVSARFINPVSSELNNIMPGDLRGIDSQNVVKKLATYGMAAVELSGTAGEILQIAPGKKATISFPIPISISGTAPAIIPLWHFDETLGLWKEEGKAVKAGNKYIGDVSHFSFWNCDVPNNYIRLDCTIKTSTGVPLAYAIVKITKIDEPQNFAYGFTDSSGYVSGAVPPNSSLKLEVFSDNECINTAIHSQTINTNAQPISLGEISVNIYTGVANVTGTVIDCNNAPVTNGFLMVYAGSKYYRYSISNTGTFSFTHYLCNNSQAVNFFAEDVNAGQQNPTPVSFTINSGNNVVPVINACGINSTEQFITYSAKGVTKSLTYPTDSLNAYPSPSGKEISCFQKINSGANSINFEIFPPVGSGTVGVGTARISSLISTLTPSMSYTSSTPIIANITEFGGQGGFISGNFTAVLNEADPNAPPGSPPGAPFTFQCNFRIKLY